MLYPGSGFRMSDEMLETYVRQLLQAHETPSVTVAWQGGEPTLMGLEFFRRSIACVEKHRRPGVTVEYSIQTNATLIDEAWAAFFKEHDFLVGISIDGPRAMHDVYRVDQGGRPTFDRVMRGLSALTAHGVEFNTLTTLHRANADRPAEVYRFLRDECGARFLQFIPIVERAAEADAARAEPIADRDGDAHAASRAAPRTSWRERPLYVQSGCEVTERSVTAEQYGRFLVAVFEEWVRRDVGTVYVQMFDVALANWNGEPPGLCVHCATCGTAPALEHNGDLYSCDHFVEPAFLLGNIAATPMTELLASPQQWRFGRNKLDGLPRHCLRCDVRFACHGGCPKDRFLVTGDDEPGLNYLCAGYQMFFRHVDAPMRFMSEALRRGRAPAEIMGVYADADRRLLARIAATGRNDPCPCGGGKKLKQCHGRASTERG